MTEVAMTNLDFEAEPGVSNKLFAGLSTMESQVLSMLAKDYSPTDIAETLNISRSYAYHVLQLLRYRFRANTNAVLVARAIAEGIVAPNNATRNT